MSGERSAAAHTQDRQLEGVCSKHTALSSGLCDDLDKWAGGSRRRRRKGMDEGSHCYPAETNATLYSNYNPIKQRKNS